MQRLTWKQLHSQNDSIPEVSSNDVPNDDDYTDDNDDHIDNNYDDNDYDYVDEKDKDDNYDDKHNENNKYVDKY